MGARGSRRLGSGRPPPPRRSPSTTTRSQDTMALSVFDLFSIGIGPSSSHTVGPMRAAVLFAERLRDEGRLEQVARVRSELFGSLGATGHGHGSDKAVLLGLTGERPELCDPRAVDARLAEIRATKRLSLLGEHEIDLVEDEDLVLHRRKTLPLHPNGMTFTALDATGATAVAAHLLLRRRWLRRRRERRGRDEDRRGLDARRPPLPHRRRAARALQGDGQVDLPDHARERAVVAHRGGGARGAARHLAAS